MVGDELGEGIYVFKLNGDGSMSPQGSVCSSKDASFIRATPDGKHLYAVHEEM